MSKVYSVPAEVREDVGKGASRRLRHQNKVPAVVYGAERDPVALTLEHDFILHAIEDEAFHSSVLELHVSDGSGGDSGDGRRQKVVLRDLQRHPFKLRVMHVDFQRISENTEIRLNVPLHFLNEEESPAGKKGGVVISHQITEIEIMALPKDLPEYLSVDLSELEPGESILMSEIKLPEGVKIPALEYEEDYDPSVVTAIFVRESQGTGALAEEADAALAEGAEPEAIEQDADEAEADDADADAGDDADGDQDSPDDEKSSD